VHDIVDLEDRGIPGAYVASSEFAEAGAAQARALGYDPAALLVPHPIQDRTDDEIRALANEAADALLDPAAGLLAKG
jgi:hypothetical protein